MDPSIATWARAPRASLDCVMRFATAVLDPQDRRAGIVVLNYLGQRLLGSASCAKEDRKAILRAPLDGDKISNHV